MMNCFQFPNFSVWDHGESVNEWFMDLYNHIMLGNELTKNWRLPNWISNPLIKTHLLPKQTLETYQLWHDIGKPYCRVVDEEGKQHFPDHEQVSYKVWNESCEQTEENNLIGYLILHDMDCHTLKGEQIEEFIKDNKACMSLILTALAEIHSNASYLNQLDSVNFKIKFKQIDKIGKKYLAHIS